MGRSLEITHREFEVIAEKYIAVNKSVYLSSGPGVGKSDIIKKIAKKQAKKLGLDFVEWNKLNDTEKQQLLSGYKSSATQTSAQQNSKNQQGNQQQTPPSSSSSSPFGKPIPFGKTQSFNSQGQPTLPGLSNINTGTTTVKDRIEEIYLFADMRLSQKDSTDIGGMPSIDNHNNISRWCPPVLMKVLSDPRCHGLLFLDELPNAPVLTQNAAYSLVLDRAAGEVTFSKNVSVFGAGNRVSDKSGVFERPSALKNRFGNFTLKAPLINDWIQDYAIPNNLDTRIIGFLSYKPDYLNTMNTNTDEDSYPTPRSLADAARLIKGETDIDLCNMLVSGQCGAGLAAEFTAWCAVGQNLNIPQILSGATPVPSDMGARWFMLGALNSYVADQFKNNGNKAIIKDYAKVLKQIDPDLQVSACYTCAQEIPSIVSELMKTPEGAQIGQQMQRLIQDK